MLYSAPGSRAESPKPLSQQQRRPSIFPSSIISPPLPSIKQRRSIREALEQIESGQLIPPSRRQSLLAAYSPLGVGVGGGGGGKGNLIIINPLLYSSNREEEKREENIIITSPIKEEKFFFENKKQIINNKEKLNNNNIILTAQMFQPPFQQPQQIFPPSPPLQPFIPQQQQQLFGIPSNGIQNQLNKGFPQFSGQSFKGQGGGGGIGGFQFGNIANIHNEFGICGWILTILSYILIFLTLPISACMSIKVVQEYERAVIFRLGRLLPGGAKGPGIFFIVPCIDTYRKVDLRVLSFEVPPQEILSKDSVTVAVDAVVYFRISNATISVTNVEDASRSTKLLAQTTLRNILGTKTLAEMLSDREAISLQMQSTLDEATEPWGVKVERVEVKDVRLPIQLQRAMAAEAEAAREARAKVVIVAEGEQKASRALKEAADVIAESPQAIQLRYLQTLNSISAEKNSTIIFPFPVDLLSALLHQQQHSTQQQQISTFQQQSQQIQSTIRSPVHKPNVFSTVVAPGTQQYQMSPGTYHSSIVSTENITSKANLL
ncbi:PHB domain-containing protein [Meloidogyne graminicola]|uniref:PHB domain-containing protein n=1 Tax=Meloidogyne graminicola TaxID=189291 RepID=A0A8S9ZTA3_9BILA|nr:PHB domain-containing protein [Meloidogyne graminicola]